MKAKICGVKNFETLNFIINHKYPPKFLGFICNYRKSKRYLNYKNLKKLLNHKKKKKIKFVSVLVNPNEIILRKIKKLNFDYLQLYDVSPKKTKVIKKKFKIKIITAITVKNKQDIGKFKEFSEITDIYLFDSKGYEKSMSFDHTLVKSLNLNQEVMIAGNIQINDNLENFKKIADIIDISGGVETSGLKDISKIEIFLNKIKNMKNET